MFHVKICGLRFKHDVQAVEASGADAIGLNFFPASVRYLDPESPTTRELSDTAKAAGLLRVGVFVNESARRIAEIVKGVGLDVIQLHGDESAEFLDELEGTDLPQYGHRRIIRAIKLPTGILSPQQIETTAFPWIDAGCHLLLDADAGSAHGGSGKTLDWSSIRRWAQSQPTCGWTLAGGLTPENVAEAIRTSGANSVDTASGVEQPRGVKSAELIGRFVAAATV